MAEEEDMIILSFFFQNKKVGLAIYDVTTTNLKILETHCATLDAMKELIERVINQFGISLLLISSRIETSVGIISWLQQYNDQNQSQIQSRIVKVWVTYPPRYTMMTFGLQHSGNVTRFETIK